MSVSPENLLEDSDESLLSRAGCADEAAFGALYDRFANRVFGMIRQMMGNTAEAEDVLQEGFVSVWNKASEFDPKRGKAFAWVVMILRHKAIDRLRARSRRTQAMEKVTVEWRVTGVAESDAPDAPLERGEQVQRVTTAMTALPESQRQLIEAAFLKGLTHHDLAEQLGLPLGTVKTNIRRGLLKLRDSLKGGLG